MLRFVVIQLFQISLTGAGGSLCELATLRSKLQGNLNIRGAKNIYFSCIYSILAYCIRIYGGVFQKSQRGKRLIALHKRSVNNLFRKFCTANSCVFKEMKLLKLNDIHKLYACVYIICIKPLY